MKLTGKTIERFLAKPDPQIMAVLVYGVDAGLVHERANQLVRGAAGRLDDPFRVAVLSGRSLKEDPARLADEAMAMSLTGGRRAVRVEDADDDVAAILKSYLAGAATAPRTDSLIVLEAEELASRSALRKLCESADQAAALPCYRDEGASLSGVIKDKLQQEGLGIAPDALSYLSVRLGGDRAVTLSELEKLALYMGGSGKTVGLADVEAAVGDSAAHAVDDLVYALSDRDMAGVERGLARSLGEGAAPISLLRAAARHFLRLQWAVGKADQGGGIEGAMRGLRPPVFFKYEDRFKSAARRWSPGGIATALERLLATEQLCKRSGSPAETLCRRVFLEIAAIKPAR